VCLRVCPGEEVDFPALNREFLGREPERTDVGVVERTYVGGCQALDAAATEVRGGVQADGRAHLVLKPYIATAVEIELDDPDDPVPYWLVSSRRPQALAAALSAAAPAPRPDAVSPRETP